MKMRRILLLFIVATIFLTSVVCHANDPYANNSNYTSVFGNSVAVLYLDKTSVHVERYAPPVYEISFRTSLYDKYANKVMSDSNDASAYNLIRYNFDTKQVWVYNRSAGRWYEQDMQGDSKIFKKLFNEVFNIAYGIPFYGGLARNILEIGGIQLGSDKAYVKSIYGEPNYTKTSFSRLEDDQIEEWKYGDSLELDFYSNGRVHRITVSANNGLATPEGLKVGMRESKIREIYGEPWTTSHKDFFPYKATHEQWLLINTENGIVKKITLGFHW